MSIPLKISPEHLKDTIVEINFDSIYTSDIIPEIALTLLTPLGFSYSPVKKNPNLTLEISDNQQISVGLGDQSKSGFFIKEDVRIQFIGNNIAFNCIKGKYIGWKNYFEIIKKVISLFISNELVRSFGRVGLRYISEFDDLDIFQNMKGSFNLGNNPKFPLQNSMLRLVHESNNIKIIMTITNKTKIVDPQTNNEKELSFFDINVSENLKANSDINTLLDSLENIHMKQKESFFESITEDFVNSLNPEY